MTTRLDQSLQKYPGHEDGIRLLASRDPSGNLKYLDWGAKMLAWRQALAPELADIIDLFHRFKGQWLPRRGRAAPHTRRTAHAARIHPDLYTYRPQDLARLRERLQKIQRASDRKRRQRERLYRIEGALEAEVAYDSPDLVVRHIKNKEACVHYGLSTKWCIAMRRERYFEDYESHNATFFFFERKAPVGDEFDKVALMWTRTPESEDGACAFTSTDRRVDMLSLAKVYGPRVFDIFREVYERSERYPGSTMFRVYDGSASAADVAEVFETLQHGTLAAYETDSLLEAICCNDAAPADLLAAVARRATAISLRARKRSEQRHFRRRRKDTTSLEKTIAMALVIHPNLPPDAREALSKHLRRRHIKVSEIHRDKGSGRIGVSRPRIGYRRRHQHLTTAKQLRDCAGMHDRIAARYRRRAEVAERKAKEAKKAKDPRGRARVVARALRAAKARSR
jgi:hypothetical protein